MQKIFVSLLMLVMITSFALAIPTTHSFISPVVNSHVIGSSVLFNVSVDSSIISISDSFGGLLCTSTSGYCSFYMDSSNFVDGSNTVTFDFADGTPSGFMDSVSFYYNRYVFVSPVDGSSVNLTSVLFNVSVDSSIISISDSFGGWLCNPNPEGYCSFYMDSSNFVDGAYNTVTFNFADGTPSGFTDSVSFNYDITAPVITVPANIVVDATSSEGAVVTYDNANSTEGLTASCVPTSGSLFAVGTTNIICSATDLAGNLGSNSFNVTVNPYVAPASSSGGSGGGSGYCNTAWTCTAWSTCNSGSQTRTCTYPANYCTPRTTKPVESQTCVSPVVANQTNNQANQTRSVAQTVANTAAGITGAVIGTTAGRWSVGILVFLIIVGLAWWIIAAKKRKATNIKPLSLKKSKE